MTYLLRSLLCRRSRLAVPVSWIRNTALHTYCLSFLPYGVTVTYRNCNSVPHSHIAFVLCHVSCFGRSHVITYVTMKTNFNAVFVTMITHVALCRRVTLTLVMLTRFKKYNKKSQGYWGQMTLYRDHDLG